VEPDGLEQRLGLPAAGRAAVAPPRRRPAARRTPIG
jgi:hypothetical protein